MKAFYLFLLSSLAGSFVSGCKQRPGAVIPASSSHAFERAEALLNEQKDSAFYYFNQAATTSKDSLEIAMAYNYMAIIQTDAGDYFGSQESLLSSLRYLDERKEGTAYCLLADYNELGGTSLNLKHYDAAIHYYDLALGLIKDSGRRVQALNNKAVVYQKMLKYEEALDIYRLIMDASINDRNEYARILSNRARVKWLQDPGFQAAPDLLEALRIRSDNKDEWGLNASYSHLADYYARSRPDSALLYAGKMLVMARHLHSPDDELEALQKLIPLSTPAASKSYFRKYEYLSDSLQTSRNAAKNQFALIRYDAEKNKADNLRLQQDNTEKRIQILRQWGFITISIGFIITLVLWYSRRQKRIELEAQEQRLSISKKVHDVVANGLYRVMAKIGYQENIDRDELLDDVEILYEQSRNISYEQSGPIRDDFEEYIAGLLEDFASPATKVLVAGNEKKVWNEVNDRIKAGLKPILQELMVNMKKHSHARNVAVRFELHGNQFKVLYRDDGVGLPPAFHFGNGLKNTGNRINDLGGRIKFDRNTTKGLKVEIVIPVA